MPPVATLSNVVTAMAGAAYPWWIIGSTAVAAHGASTMVADIDVLFDIRDAAIIRATGASLTPGVGDGRFRSALYGRCEITGFPVEFMGDLDLMTDAGWVRVRPVSRELRALGGVFLPVPNRTELIELLVRFGRAKDHARAALLTA